MNNIREKIQLELFGDVFCEMPFWGNLSSHATLFAVYLSIRQPMLQIHHRP